MSIFLKLTVSMRSISLLLKRECVIVITIIVALTLGNIVPVYSTDSITQHDTHKSMMNLQKTIIEEPGMSGNNSKSYAEKIVEFCQDDNDHCAMEALDYLNKTINRQLVLGTFSDLIQIYDENDYSCHHEGHHLGMWLYDYLRHLNEALNHATLLCGGSVYHGIFQSYFGGEQFDHDVDRNQIKIAHLCPMGQQNVNWLQERDCIHGIGHGLLELYNYNTTAAVDRCNEFILLWAQSACSRGIFMENTEYFVETGLGDFDINDIYFPCNAIVEKFASQCYYYYPKYYLERNDLTLKHNHTEAFAQCDDISPSKFVKYCYEGIGRLLAPIAYTNPEQAIAYCYSGNQSTYHDDCLTGTLKTILKGDAKTEVGFNYCSYLNLDFKATCYEVVGIWIQLFLNADKLELESECSKAPDVEYVINCINSKSNTKADVTIFEPV
jgi:hypothetical protein